MSAEDDRPKWVADLPPWLTPPGPGSVGHTLERKTRGRILVRTEADVDRVIDIMRMIDPMEVEHYMPEDFVAVWTDAYNPPPPIYGYKFEIRTDLLAYLCFRAGISILIVTGVRP